MRAETGPMKFDDDWSGVFIRGDNAFAFAQYLRGLLDEAHSHSDKEICIRTIRNGLLPLLENANDHVSHPVQHLKSFKECMYSISLASQDNITMYQAEINKILAALGHPEALVTDQSCIRDFPVVDSGELHETSDDEEDDDVSLQFLRVWLGVPLELTDTLVDIARRIRERSM